MNSFFESKDYTFIYSLPVLSLVASNTKETLDKYFGIMQIKINSWHVSIKILFPYSLRYFYLITVFPRLFCMFTLHILQFPLTLSISAYWLFSIHLPFFLFIFLWIQLIMMSEGILIIPGIFGYYSCSFWFAIAEKSHAFLQYATWILCWRKMNGLYSLLISIGNFVLIPFKVLLNLRHLHPALANFLPTTHSPTKASDSFFLEAM